MRFLVLLSELDNALGETEIIKDDTVKTVVSGLDVLPTRLETPLSPEGDISRLGSHWLARCIFMV